MILLPIIILAIVQGITEFLPISSSGHLVLLHEVTNDGLSAIDKKRLDIAVHIGTLIAVILYFWRDFLDLVLGGIDIVTGHLKTPKAIKLKLIMVASLPIFIVGFIVFQIDMTMFDTIVVIGWTSIIFAIFLYVADQKIEKTVTVQDFTLKHALYYGLAQCLALIPGVSRSGITMTAGRFMGHSRTESARMSMMMGMVTIAAAGMLTSFSLFRYHEPSDDFLIMALIGMIVSFITAYLAIWVMMKWFENKGNMKPFVIYRILLGIVLLGFVYLL